MEKNNEKQLPSDLAEMIEKASIIEWNGIKCVSTEECAQIAVDYQLQESDRLVSTLGDATELILKLEQQRKQMLDNIRNLNSVIDEYWNGERSDSQVKKINQVQQESFGILKKYEDGKA